MGIRILLGIVLAGFLAMTALAVTEHGYLGFFELAAANSATRLLFVDLVITLTLFLAWMWRDARQRGAKPASLVPYALVTLLFGAAGPLLYLIRREPKPA